MKNTNKRIYQIGLNVRLAREDRNLTQLELAALIDKNRQRIGQVESGKKCEIEVYNLIAEAMEMEFHELAAYHINRGSMKIFKKVQKQG